MSKPKLELAHLSDAQIATISLDAGAAVFSSLVSFGVTTGPNGPDALHMRVGAAVHGTFVQWGERTIGNGDAFTINTDGKAETATVYEMNSDDAFAEYGDDIPEGPQRWTGGVFVQVQTKLDDNTVVELDPNVAAASGVQGEIDRTVSATVANVAASLVSLREKARYTYDA